MFESLKLSEIPQNHCGVMRESSSTRPKVWIIEEKGVRAVVKDFSVNRFLYRNTVGRFLIWREEKAYRRLRGLEGVPDFYRVIDGVAIVLGEVQGRDVENLEKERKLAETFFRELTDLLESVHSRGLAHCDLKRGPQYHDRPLRTSPSWWTGRPP